MKYLWFLLVLGRSDELLDEYISRLQTCEEIMSVADFQQYVAGQCPPARLTAVSPTSPDPVLIDVHPEVYREGSTGLVYRSTDGKWTLKVPKSSSISTEVLEMVCREKIVLEYLNKRGLMDMIPEYLEAVDVEPHCAASLLVSENVGKYVLSDLSTGEGSVIANTPVVYPLVARLITIMKTLHENGVVHRDMHGRNWVFSDSSDIPTSLRIVDFGETQFIPLLSPRSHTWAEYTDLNELVGVVREITADRFNRGDPVIVEEISRILTSMSKSETGFLESDYDTLMFLLEPEMETETSFVLVSPHLRMTPVDPKTDVLQWTTARELDNILQDPNPLESQLNCVERLREFKNYKFPTSEPVVLNSISALFTPVSYSSVEPSDVFEFYTLTNFGCLERDRARRVDQLLTSHGVEARYITPQGHVSPWNTLFYEKRRALKYGRGGWFLVSRDTVTAAKIAVGVLRKLRAIHALGVVTNGSSLVLDLLFRDSDIKAGRFDSVVFSNSAQFQLFVDPDTHAYLDPLRPCSFPQANVNSLSPGELYGLCSTRYDDLYRLSELLLMVLKRDLDVARFGSVMGAKWHFTKDWSVQGGELFAEFHQAMFLRSEERDVSRPNYESWITLFQNIIIH